MTTGRAFRLTSARKCSSRSCGWTTRATRTRAAPDWDLPSPAISRARMAAISRSQTARSGACARLYGFRSKRRQPAATRRALLATEIAGNQRLQLFRVLDVHLEAAGHHDVAGLLIRFAGPEPLRLDLGRGIERLAGGPLVAMRGGRDRVGG